MGLTRCFNRKGRIQSLCFQGFGAFCTFSFLFLEMWEWPPAQRNDLGFKFEILAQSKRLKRGTALKNRRWSVSFLLTHDAFIRSLARNGLLNPSTSAGCKKHFSFPFPCPPGHSSRSTKVGPRVQPRADRSSLGENSPFHFIAFFCNIC